MKERNWFVVGVLALALIFGMVLGGCEDPTDDDAVTGKSLTITDISGKTGQVMVQVANADGSVAMGVATVSGNKATFVLLTESGSPWTGSGEYYLALMFDSDSSQFIYTNGGNAPTSFEQAPKYSFTASSSTISFSKFKTFTFE
jgi:hypothetical protein